MKNSHKQKEREIEKLNEAAMNTQQKILNASRMKEIMKKAQDVFAKDEQKSRRAAAAGDSNGNTLGQHGQDGHD